MQLTIEHRLAYAYTEPVILEPQQLLLFPRMSRGQRLLNYQLTIDPLPDHFHQHLDAYGNQAQWYYLNQATDHLRIELKLTLDSPPDNAFNFIINPYSASQLPMVYPGHLVPVLRPYLGETEIQSIGVSSWAQDILDASGNDTLSFLTRICQVLGYEFSQELRLEGPPREPAQTLQLQMGACRDLSQLMIAACQLVGLAARFVSGYAFADNDLTRHELHAWVEVYLPGAGWRGFDPSLGGITGNQHVVLAAGPSPNSCAPLSGAYRGKGGSHFTAEVDITAAFAQED